MVNFLPDDKKAAEQAEREAVARAKNNPSSDMVTPNVRPMAPANNSSTVNNIKLSEPVKITVEPPKPTLVELSRLVDSPAARPTSDKQQIHPGVNAEHSTAGVTNNIEIGKNLPTANTKPMAGPDITTKKPSIFDFVKNIFKKKSVAAPVMAADTKEEALNVNLLPEQFQQASEVKEKLIFLLALAGSAVILAVAGWGAFSLLTKAKVAERAQYEEQIKIENQAVAALKKQIQESSSKGRQVLAVQQILAARRNYLAFLDELQKQTLSVVSFDALSLSDTDNLSLMAKAPTLEEAAKQYNIFKNSPTLFINASVTQFSAKEKSGADSKGGVSFPITLTINKEIFAKPLFPFLNTGLTQQTTAESQPATNNLQQPTTVENQPATNNNQPTTETATPAAGAGTTLPATNQPSTVTQ